MSAEASKKIRGLLKAAGYGKADLSVHTHSYSMGSTVYVTIKRAEVPLSQVKPIAAAGEDIRRDADGDILSGGNCFVDVRYGHGVLDAHAAIAQAQLDAGRCRFGDYSITEEHGEVSVWKDDADGTGNHIERVLSREHAGARFAHILAAAGMLSVLDEEERERRLRGLPPWSDSDKPPAELLERMNEAAAQIEPVRANSFLSPLEFIGAEQYEADRVGASIDNLVEPVRRGHISIREALETMARSAWNVGFSAGDRWARRG